MKRTNPEVRARRTQKLRQLAVSHGLQLQEYSIYHLRLFGGVTVIDYWPGSGKCWITGSNSRSLPVEPEGAIEVALAQSAPDYVLAQLSQGSRAVAAGETSRGHA